MFLGILWTDGRGLIIVRTEHKSEISKSNFNYKATMPVQYTGFLNSRRLWNLNFLVQRKRYIWVFCWKHCYSNFHWPERFLNYTVFRIVKKIPVLFKRNQSWTSVHWSILRMVNVLVVTRWDSYKEQHQLPSWVPNTRGLKDSIVFSVASLDIASVLTNGIFSKMSYTPWV
jgi:hypothetical protein